MNEQTAQKLKLNNRSLDGDDCLNMTSANGSTIQVNGTAEVQLFFQALVIPETL